MEPFGVFATVAVAATLISRYLLSLRPARGSWEAYLDAWKDAARACGLDDVETGGFSLTGRSGSLRVRFERYGGSEDQGTRIRVSGLLLDLTIRPQGIGDALSGLRGAREVVLGDDAFDEAAWVTGDPASVRALLDHACRQTLLTLFAGSLEHRGPSTLWVTGRVEQGVLILDAPTSNWLRRSPQDGPVHATGLHLMPDVLRAGLALARRLVSPGHPARPLAENLAKEPVVDVRLRALDTLMEEFPDHPATQAALLAAREDPDAGVRLRAGIALGDAGRDVLLETARGHGADDATTARAVGALGQGLSAEEATRLLRDALRTRREATARACMETLGRAGGEEAVATLLRVLAVERGPLAVAAATALAETGDPEAEAPLLRALVDAPPPVQEAAARALGRVGTAEAVAPLRETESGRGDLRRAARQAIAEIQERLAGTSGASAGQLSLSTGQSGQVSLADDASGRLSLPPKPGTDRPETGTEE